MKFKLAVLFLGILAIASGCASKCPPCPTCGGGYATSGSGLYSGSAPSNSAPVSNNMASNSAPSSYGANSGRYVSK